jgi:uncharacterized protein YjbI with pentapeptide repeats
VTDKTEAGRDTLDIDTMDLCGSRFTRVNLSGTVLRDVVLTQTQIDDANMTGLRVDNTDLSGSQFTNVSLMGGTIANANLRDLQIIDADMTGMTLNGVLVSDLFQKWEKP